MHLLTDRFIHDDVFTTWRSHLDEIGPPPTPARLPTGDELIATLRYLDAPEEDIPDIVRFAPSPASDPDAWWYLERLVHSLALHMGALEQPPRPATLKDLNDPTYRFFYVHALVAALPQAQVYFRKRGIPEDIVQLTLADLGRNIRVHRKREGVGGLGVAFWLMLHFRGMIYQLGRLQFERHGLGERIATDMVDSGRQAGPDDYGLSIHIPDFSGPMTPDACDGAIAHARDFFPRYFPEEPVRAGLCHSWLLDPQLKGYLGPESNIIQFQDRFHLVPGGTRADNSVVQFVFGPTLKDPGALPQRSRLERAVASHLQNGKHWEARLGWFPW